MGFRTRRRATSPAPWQRGAVTGLELGSTAVRAVVVGNRAATGAPIVQRAASVPLPAGAMVGGVVREPPAVTAALRRLGAQHGLRGNRVVLGIGTPLLVVRPLTLPAMPPEELRRALPFQARDVLPFPVADAVLDFSPLPRPGSAPSSGPVDGLLTAAPRTAVLAAVQAVQAAGFTIDRVDLSPFGVLRSTGSAGPVVEALIDIGAELTTIVIHRHGIPHVVRVIAFGGRRLTDRLADALGVAAAEAELAKRSVGVVGDSMPALQLRDELRPLLAELRASLRYFVSTVGSTVQRALLTGGSAGLPGLAGLLTDELDLRVEVASSLRHLAGGGYGGGRVRDWAGDEVGGSAGDGPGGMAASAVAVGLALGMPRSTTAAGAAPSTVTAGVTAGASSGSGTRSNSGVAGEAGTAA